MSANSVTFDVIGVPAPQGSKSAFVRGGRAVIVDGTSKAGRAKHLNWRDDVTKGAMLAKSKRRFEGPVSVGVTFYLPLPASDQHRTLHSTKPDIDKLIRSVLDSLTVSGLVTDDALVSTITATKVYARDGHWTGARITLVDRSAVEESNRDWSKQEAKRIKNAAKAS